MQGWVEGLSFRPASIQQADRPPPSLGERVKESVEKARGHAAFALARIAMDTRCCVVIPSAKHLARLYNRDLTCLIPLHTAECCACVNCRSQHPADAGADC